MPLRRSRLFDHMVVELAQGGPAPGSWRNLVTHANKYREFTQLLNIAPFPITEQNFCWYMAFLTFSLTSADSVLNYLLGVKKLHAYARVPMPKFSAYVDTVYAGVKRLLAHQVQQAEPITPQILREISELVDKSVEKQVVCFTALVVGFYLFLRSSNLTSRTQTSFDPQKNLTRNDIRMAENVGLIEIRWSKTIQFLQRKLLVPLVKVLHQDICPLFWLKFMVRLVPATSVQPAFCLHNRYGNLVPLTYQTLTDQLRAWIFQTGRDPSHYSLHGLRRGGASFAFESNLAAESIMLLGDWASESFRRYLDHNLESRLRSMTQIIDRCNSL